MKIKVSKTLLVKFVLRLIFLCYKHKNDNLKLRGKRGDTMVYYKCLYAKAFSQRKHETDQHSKGSN